VNALLPAPGMGFCFFYVLGFSDILFLVDRGLLFPALDPASDYHMGHYVPNSPWASAHSFFSARESLNWLLIPGVLLDSPSGHRIHTGWDIKPFRVFRLLAIIDCRISIITYILNCRLLAMGAQLSALQKDIETLLPKGTAGWLRSLHVMAHYAVVPAIYAYGLVQAGEFTWNPVTLLDKIMLA
jgi:hypothetical protein